MTGEVFLVQWQEQEMAAVQDERHGLQPVMNWKNPVYGKHSDTPKIKHACLTFARFFSPSHRLTGQLDRGTGACDSQTPKFHLMWATSLAGHPAHKRAADITDCQRSETSFLKKSFADDY